MHETEKLSYILFANYLLIHMIMNFNSFTPQHSFLLTTSSSLLILLLLLHSSQTTSKAINHHHCPPSSCGIIRNISYPFRLKNDPHFCGDQRFLLGCEDNVTSIYFDSHKYYVKAINYDNYTIRVVDASIDNDDICSFPSFSTYYYNSNFEIPYDRQNSMYYSNPINFISCPNPLKNSSSLFTEINNQCDFSSNSSSHPTRSYAYIYIKVGHMNASELPETCTVEMIVTTSYKFKDLKNVSLSEIHNSLLYGFEFIAFCVGCRFTSSSLMWIEDHHLVILLVIVGLLCAVVSPPVFTILGFAAIVILLRITGNLLYVTITDGVPAIPTVTFGVIELVTDLIIWAPRLIGFPLVMWFLIYKFRRRHLSMYNRIESFLRSDNRLTPIRYSYSDIKKMTRGFREKLGEGGFGSVYKGKLRSGHHVAVKLLGKSGASGQDFMNEIATIGRIHHVNVVQLVGYCAQGSKCALVFDFMPNGSLEKYLFNREKMSSLNWDTKFEIAVGVAKGIEYLHRGCDVQILHFDIKPHNILLDENFIPKISDFGLAKLCSTEKKTVTMTAARGTIGYVAPELISRSIGAVSNKADVYSFGMLLMEMVGLNRELKGNNDDSSKYFPCWIYDCFNQGKDIEIMEANENEDSESTRKFCRKMTIVALWCIQMSPDDRPSMSKVLEMLEADVDRLRIPDYPSQSTQTIVNEDETGITSPTDDSVSMLHHDDASPSVEIIVQDLGSLP